MSNNQNFIFKLDTLITHWTNEGIKMNSGISQNAIRVFENEFGICFEDTFNTYLTRSDGFVDFESDQEWFSFWSIDRMKKENTDNSHPQCVVWFSDYSINLCSFGFHKTDKKIYVHFQHIDGIECVANTFSEFIDVYLEDPIILLR